MNAVYGFIAAAFAGMIGAHLGWIFVGRKLATLDVIEHIHDYDDEDELVG